LYVKRFTGRDISHVPVDEVQPFIEEADIIRGFEVEIVQEAIANAFDGDEY